MTPDQARQLAIHVHRTWPDEPVDAWRDTLLPLDHDITAAVLARCRARYTGRRLPHATFRSEYGTDWPTIDLATPCDNCSSTGVLDVNPDGTEVHCPCPHGTQRATTVAADHPPAILGGRYLTAAERANGLAQVARLRQLLDARKPA